MDGIGFNWDFFYYHNLIIFSLLSQTKNKKNNKIKV
jgi:hypothetical protein